jgi:hypothetical protein
MRGEIAAAFYPSNPTRRSLPPKQPRRQQQHRTNQCEECFERDADQPERQRQKPDHGKENQREQRHWPAKHEQDAPTDKENQSFHIVTLSSRRAQSTSAPADEGITRRAGLPGKGGQRFMAAALCRAVL